MRSCLNNILLAFVVLAKLVASDNAEGESSTIRIEDRENGVLPQGPWLPDPKYKEGQPPETQELPIQYWTVIEKALTWTEAALACEQMGTQLAVLPNYQEATKLQDQLKMLNVPADVIDDPKNFGDMNETEFGASRRYWIGLTDHLVEGKWMWIGIGKPLIYDDMWYPGQPSHNEPGTTTPGEHCGSLWNPGYYIDDEIHKFNDAPCTDKYYPICDNRPLETLHALFPDSDEEPSYNVKPDDDD